MAVVKEGIEKAEKSLEHTSELKVKIDSITWELPPEKQGKLDLAKDLIDQIFSLDEKDNKTTAEIDEIKGKIELLNGLGLGDLKLSFDDLTGHIKESKKQVIALYEEIKKQYQIEALHDAFVEAYKYQAEAQIQLKEDIQNKNDLLGEEEKLAAREKSAKEAFLKSMGFKDYGEYMDKIFSGETIDMNATQSKLFTEWDDAATNLGTVRTALGKANEAVDSSLEAVGQANKKIKTLNQRLETLNSDANDVATTFHDYFEPQTDSQKAAFNSLNKAVKNSYKAMDLWNKLQLKDKDAMVEIKIALKKAAQNGDQELDRVTYDVKSGKLPMKVTMEKDAEGGFVGGGHLFFANENGNPEYIGSINGKTAVANRDQMSEAIENASFRGMARALKENGGNGGETVVVIEPNSENLFKVTQKQAKDYYNRTGRQAFGY